MAKAKGESVPEEAPDVELYTEEFIEEEVWAYEPAGPSLTARLVAEAVGTFALVLLGVGAAALSGVGSNGTLAIGLSFGITVLAGVIAVGHISGAHFNPAVTVGAWIAGRLQGGYVIGYILAQVIGGALGAAVLAGVFGSHPDISNVKNFMSTTAIGFGEHSPANFSMVAAIIIEAVAVALLVAVVLASTSVRAPKGAAPFSIGLTLAILVMWAIPFTNAGLNPARATATAIFSESWALGQLWVFWLAPLIGAAIVGLLFRAFSPEEEFETVEVLDVIED